MNKKYNELFEILVELYEGLEVGIEENDYSDFLNDRTYDEVYNTYKERFESMNCFQKYKSYTNSNCVPSFCRNLQTIVE